MKNLILIISIITILSIFSLNVQAQNGNDRHPAFRDVKSAKIIVSQSYGNANKISLPFKEGILTLLNYAGIKQDSVNYDVIVTIIVKGSPNGSQYSGYGGYLWTGASLSGSISFESISNSDVRFVEYFSANIEPPKQIYSYDEKSPNDAPFWDTYVMVLPTIIKSVYKPFGLTPLFAATKENNQDYFWKAALDAIMKTKDNRAIEPLIKSYLDKNLYYYVNNVLDSIDSNWENSEPAKKSVPWFISVLKDKANKSRKYAAGALGDIKDIRAVGPLIEAMKDNDMEVQISSIYALGKINDNRAIEPLITTLENQNIDIRRAAIIALSNFNDIHTIKPLLAALKDQDVQDAASDALKKVKDSRAIEPLCAGLVDPDRFVKLSSARALLNMKDSLDVNTLIALLQIYVELNEITEILKTLDYKDSNWGNSEAAKNSVPRFIKYINFPYPNVKKDALLVLSKIKDPRAFEALITASKDINPSIRETSINLLGTIEDDRTVELLFGALKDQDKKVKNAAKELLINKKKFGTIEPLLTALKDSDLFVRRTSLLLISREKDSRLVDPLIAALSDSVIQVRLVAAEALGVLYDSRAVEPLIAALGDNIIQVRLEAANALGKLMDRRAVEPLITLLNDKDSEIRIAAVGALKEITGQDFGEDYKMWKKWWKKNKQ
jgi:HEAT repeat protein